MSVEMNRISVVINKIWVEINKIWVEMNKISVEMNELSVAMTTIGQKTGSGTPCICKVFMRIIWSRYDKFSNLGIIVWDISDPDRTGPDPGFGQNLDADPDPVFMRGRIQIQIGILYFQYLLAKLERSRNIS